MKKKTLQIIIFFVFFLLLLNIKSYAGSQKWNSLNYDVTVNSDCSMDVVETWEIKISETNTLFKDFYIDSSKYSEITDVRVVRVVDGEEVPLDEIFVEQYHVDDGCFYALQTDYNKFEIAWNIGLDNSTATRTYKIYYTVNDVVKLYNDCSELYWQFLGTDNEISGKNIAGTIKLPYEVDDIENLKVWAHGDLNGNIERTDRDLVKFSINSLSENTMLEVRVVIAEEQPFIGGALININKLPEILEEEQRWADEANYKREFWKKMIFIVIGANALVFALCFIKAIKIIKKGKELKKIYKYPEYDIDYFREVPDEENASPARASFLYSGKDNNCPNAVDISKVFAATILDLSLKKMVEFEPLDEKNIKIKINQNANNENLPEDEKIIFSILKSAVGEKEGITTKEFSKYARKNYESVYTKLEKLHLIVTDYEKEKGNLDEERRKIRSKIVNREWIYIIIGMLLIMLIPFMLFLVGIYAGIIILLIVNGMNISKVGKLSNEGFYETKRWVALKKYMEDYSLLKEKTVPDIVLWEKFLVYATTFGISKKVIEQLKVVHPEMFMSDNTNMVYNRYAYWYIISNNNFGTDCFNSFSSGLEKVYSNAASAYSSAHSSGSGSGGGFSGGGGGRRRWRRLRWSLKYI